MLTLKAIKAASKTIKGVNSIKRGGLLRDHYNELRSEAMESGKDITVKFHGVFTWSFSSPCHLRFTPSGVIELISYATDVADYYPASKVLLVNGWYSMTTGEHVDEFSTLYRYTCNRSAAVSSKCWETSAKNGYELGNLVALGLGSLLSKVDQVKNVFKYQYYQMGEILTDLVKSCYGGYVEAMNDTPAEIISKALDVMTDDNRRACIECGSFWCDNRRNLGKSWDHLETVMRDYLNRLDDCATREAYKTQLGNVHRVWVYLYKHPQDLGAVQAKLYKLTGTLTGNASDDVAAVLYSGKYDTIEGALDLAACDIKANYKEDTGKELEA